MSLFYKYKPYFLIIGISIILGIIRWSILDRDFPLFSKPQIIFNEFISYQEFKSIVDNNSHPIIDARDYLSYNEEHIENSINIDIELLYELDEKMFKNINDIINLYGYSDNIIQINNIEENYKVADSKNDNQKIIVYCWNPKCDRAEELISILIDTSEYFGQFGKYFTKSDFSIYRGGWDEWDSIQKK